MTQRARSSSGRIRRELEKRAEAIAASLPKLMIESLLGPADADQSVENEFRQRGRDLIEYARWLGPPLSVMSETERARTLQAEQSRLLADGFAPLEVIEYLRIAQADLPGRPATRRHLAVTALDLWLDSPDLSWLKVTRQVCTCGEATHGTKCQESLRQQVNDLKEFLKNRGIALPPRAASPKR